MTITIVIILIIMTIVIIKIINHIIVDVPATLPRPCQQIRWPSPPRGSRPQRLEGLHPS